MSESTRNAILEECEVSERIRLNLYHEKNILNCLWTHIICIQTNFFGCLYIRVDVSHGWFLHMGKVCFIIFSCTVVKLFSESLQFNFALLMYQQIISTKIEILINFNTFKHIFRIFLRHLAIPGPNVSLDCHTAGLGSIPGRNSFLSTFNFFL